ncbi:acyltransferase [Alicyclobacillus kakegawensis]|uniref:acyltransferase n=1 Tax=Alicyclobacillus kakegawensis TaxID=392012 RepID=UPI00082E80AD|nr:acyltransferase [Alicyclobacillus kakegawensis]
MARTEQKRHLYEVDLMRAFIMLSVISVHTLARFIEMEPQQAATPLLILGAVITPLHFTREAFMFITGLVLFITYYRRDFSTLKFWRKRFSLIAIPYLFWNIIYIVFGGITQGTYDWSLGSMIRVLAHSLEVGNQFYLYYVLVTMQLYVVFPVLLYGLRKLERWHTHIFIASFILELGLMYLTKFVLSHLDPSSLPGILSHLDIHRQAFLLTYQFWFIAGGVVACHYDRIMSFMDTHARMLWTTLGVAVVIVVAHYFVDQLVLMEGSSLSETVLQPIMVPFSLIVIACMGYAGFQWAKRRELPAWRPFSRFIKTASDTSFGIFLIQPFPLYVMETTVQHLQVPSWVHFSLIPVSVLFVYFSSMLVAYGIGKVPGLAYCVGRKVNIRMVQSTSATA